MFCCFLAAGLRNGRVECSFHCFTCTQRNQSSLFFCLLRVQFFSQVVLRLYSSICPAVWIQPHRLDSQPHFPHWFIVALLLASLLLPPEMRSNGDFLHLVFCLLLIHALICVISVDGICFCLQLIRDTVTPGWESVHRLTGIVLFTHLCGKLSGKNVTGGATPPNHTHTHTYNHTCTNTHSSDISLKDKCQPETWLTGQNKPTSGGSSEVLFGRWRLINN